MSNDFDFLIGKWKVFNMRLKSWLCECNEWVSFESDHLEQRGTLGHGNFALHQYTSDNTLFERSIIRQYDEHNQYWKIDRIDNMSPLIIDSLKGFFWKNQGSFLSWGTFNGQKVLVWAQWTRICETYACWEQALSEDLGMTWETNWTMEFFKEKD